MPTTNLIKEDLSQQTNCLCPIFNLKLLFFFFVCLTWVSSDFLMIPNALWNVRQHTLGDLASLTAIKKRGKTSRKLANVIQRVLWV